MRANHACFQRNLSRALALSVALGLGAVGCGSDEAASSSGGSDAGGNDSAVQDAAQHDGGSQDASEPDATSDGGSPGDAGNEDAAADAPAEDAASNDSSAPDAQPPDAAVEGGTPDGGGADASAHQVELWLKSDLTPKTFSDGYEGQTPKSFSIGISRFELMEAADDPTPAVVFDYGADYLEIDVLSETLVGYADLQSIPVGVYSHGRVKLDAIRMEVATKLHPTMPPIPVDGDLTVVGALSDAVIDGTARTKGWAEYTFSFYTTPFSQQATLPAFPSTGAGTIEETPDETYLVFAFDSPLPVAAIPGMSFKATLTMDEYESFRWEDLSTAGYVDGAFDTEQSGTSEPVRNIGATDYRISVETQ